jgi:hypothetical protein
MGTLKRGGVRKSVIINAVFPALIGAAFGMVCALLILRDPKKTNKETLQAAYAGEIEVIHIALRGAAKNAFSAWQENRELVGQKFSYSRAIFDGNVAHLGEVGDKQLIRDIAFLYAVLEQARGEGRHLEGQASDSEGLFRYAHYLWSALGLSMALIEKLSGEPPKISQANTERARQMNAKALEVDTEFLATAADKFWEVLLPEEFLQDNKTKHRPRKH